MLGRFRFRKLKRRIQGSVESRFLGAAWFIASSRPARWIARQRAVRFAVLVVLLLWRFFAKYVWWPVKRFARRLWQYGKRHEVLAWTLTWVACAALGWLIAATIGETRTLHPIFLKLAGGVVATIAFTIISFRSPLAGLLIWLVGSPLLNALIYFKFVEGTPLVTGDKVCIFILLVVFLMQPRSRSNLYSNKPLHASMFVFVAAMLISTARSENPKWAMQAVLDIYLMPILVYLFARAWIIDRRTFLMAMIAVICVGAYFCMFGIPEHFTQRNLFTFSGRPAWVESELGTVRVQGPSASPQEFGLVVLASLMLAIVGISHATRRGPQFLYALVIIIALTGIALTLRRSVYISVVAGLLVLLLAGKSTRRSTAIMLALLGIGLLAYWPTLYRSRLYSERLTDPVPVYRRAVIQATAWNVVKHHPVFGVGVDNFPIAKKKYLVPHKDIPVSYGGGLRSTHNSYLRIMAEGGMFAFLPLVSMILWAFITSFNAYRRAKGVGLLGRDTVVAFWGIMLSILAQSATTDSFYHNRYLIALWLFYLGAIAGLHLRKEVADEPVQERTEVPTKHIARPVIQS